MTKPMNTDTVSEAVNIETMIEPVYDVTITEAVNNGTESVKTDTLSTTITI